VNQHTRVAHTGSWERARTLAVAADFLARVLPSSNRNSIVRVPAGIYAVSKRPAGRSRVTGRRLRRSPATAGCAARCTQTRGFRGTGLGQDAPSPVWGGPPARMLWSYELRSAPALPAPDFLPPGSSLSLTPSCCSIFVTALGPAHAGQTPGGAAEQRRPAVQARARTVYASPLDQTAPPRAGPVQRYLGSGMPSRGVSIAAAGTAAESRKSTSATPSGCRAAPCAVREARMAGNMLVTANPARSHPWRLHRHHRMHELPGAQDAEVQRAGGEGKGEGGGAWMCGCGERGAGVRPRRADALARGCAATYASRCGCWQPRGISSTQPRRGRAARSRAA
jgi:hypothetical protein